MRRVMDGETVYVAVKSEGEADRLGNPADSWAEPVAVDNVLVSYKTSADQGYSRPDGFVVTCTMAFPRSCTLDLRGAKVTVRGEELEVYGNPRHVMSPLDGWDMTVEAGGHGG